jgi:hypothetical protein
MSPSFAIRNCAVRPRISSRETRVPMYPTPSAKHPASAICSSHALFTPNLPSLFSSGWLRFLIESRDPSEGNRAFAYSPSCSNQRIWSYQGRPIYSAPRCVPLHHGQITTSRLCCRALLRVLPWRRYPLAHTAQRLCRVRGST